MAALGEQDLDPAHLWKNDSIEERIFSAALICLEAHYLQSPVMGAQSMTKVLTIITKTLEKTHTLKDVREVLSRNVRIWIWLKRAVCAALCDLNEKSLGVRSVPMVQTKFIDITTPDVTALIIKNYATLKEALQMLNKLMHIARNLLVTTTPQVPQDLSAAIAFDQEVYEAICLCVNVTSKGIDGEMPEDDASRVKLNEITELYKKVLVTSLQQAHNWIAKNDRNKMTFWFRVLIESPDVDNNPAPEDRHEPVLDYLGPRCLALKTEVSNWLKRNSHMSPTAAAICKEYLEASDRSETEDWFPQDKNLAWNYSPEATWEFKPDIYGEASKAVSAWIPDEPDKFEQDRLYGHVSHELDEWWEDTRIPNASNWSIAMYPTELVPERIKECESILLHRYDGADIQDEHIETVPPGTIDEGRATEWQGGHASQSTPSYAPEYDEYDDPDDDDSYGEGPMTGLLTEVPNILDPKQIEALHMIVKSCILESAGTGVNRHGESMQKARCRILLATDCGKNLLREMLVFIAVWEKDDQSLIFQITSQIVQAIHESSLLPYAWNALRSPKDIISPAQTVLLKMITYLCRTALYPSKEYNPEPDLRSGDMNRILNNDEIRLAKMVNFLYGIFRSRIVPECVALMQIQGEVRTNRLDPAEFPVDNWDLERGKEGLVQYLDFLYTVADIYPLRQHLIEYEAVYELIKLLEGLDVGVEKIPFAHSRRHDSSVHPAAQQQQQQHQQQHHHSHPGAPNPAYPNGGHNPSNGNLPPPPPPPPPPLADPPHEFPWTGLKGQVLSIMAALLQPPPGQSSPGNPAVQMQIVQHNGIVALLNCCLYDDNNRFCRERTQLCLKWLMDGSPDASAFLQNLVQANQHAAGAGAGAGSMRPPPAPPGGAAGPTMQTVRIDGVPGEVKVQVRSSSAPAAENNGPGAGRPAAATMIPAGALGGNIMPPLSSPAVGSSQSGSAAATLDHRVSEHRSRSEELVNDLLALTVADGAAAASGNAVPGNGGLQRVTSLSDDYEEEEGGHHDDEADDETEDDFM
ncbi:uncharacterized protein B0I36DRAFT_379271 [Microdochium trichocladiopsis]|uniref:Ataxin-10 homolog n=1 Tax=Microdochium trichocladiopsis TaxID=1682393 RepID=A0A9P8YJN2_9PEZI|nr:uncharacterized protein B0I36DRAFT_379271 [Microdochium trichocladiopsis]KAH7040254.1 hypothetical protein B0I36DRAFT_379271 [Microdochium trichocladiopsis]